MVWEGCFLCTGSKRRSPGQRGRRSRPACLTVKLTVRCSSLGVWRSRSSFVGRSTASPWSSPKASTGEAFHPVYSSLNTTHAHTHTHVILFLGRKVHNSKTEELTFFVLLMIKCMKLSLGWIIFDIFCAVETMRFFFFSVSFCFAVLSSVRLWHKKSWKPSNMFCCQC